MPKAAAIILNWGMGSGIRKEMPFVPVPQRIGRMWAEPHKKGVIWEGITGISDHH